MQLGRKAVLSVASQGLNTAQNLVLAILAARHSTAAEYGAWGIAFAVFIVCQNLTRSIVSTPRLIAADADRTATGVGAAASLIVSLPMTLVVGAAGLLLPGELRDLVLCVAAVLCGTLLHDALRYEAIRTDAYRGLVVLDGAWLVLQLVGTGVLVWRGAADAVTLTLVWGLAALVASLGYSTVVGVLPRMRPGLQFLREERRAGGLMAIETFLGSAAVNAVPAVVGATLGLAAAGSFRAAMTVIGGIGLFIAGLTPLMTLESARRLRSGGRAAVLLTAWSVGIGALSVLYMAVFFALPDRLGEALLGDSWSGARSILLMFAVAVAVRGPFSGAPIILRVRRHFDAAIKLRLMTGWVQVAGPLLGALVAGLPGAAWGYAGAAIVNDAQAVRAVRRSTHLTRREGAQQEALPTRPPT